VLSTAAEKKSRAAIDQVRGLARIAYGQSDATGPAGLPASPSGSATT
jgi:hypothetical protein